MEFVETAPLPRLGALQRRFARAIQGSESVLEQGNGGALPVMAGFLPELLRLHMRLLEIPGDVTSLVHERLFIYSERHQHFQEATASALIRECRVLRKIFVPLVSQGAQNADSLSLAHDIIDACMSYVVDAFIHEEELLRQSRAKFAEIIDTIPQLVWRTTVDGEATFANRPFLDYVGCSREEVLGWGWMGYIHPDDRNHVTEEWGRCRAREEPVRVAFRVRGTHGYRWFLSLGNPYRDEHGTMVAYYGTWTDIDDYKAIEQRLQQAIRARDEFLCIASHELKTPLTALQLQVEMQERAIKRGDPRATSVERVRRLLSTNAHHISRIGRLVNDMLDVARIESGHLALAKQTFDMGEFVANAVERMRPTLEAAGCPVSLDVSPVMGTWDADRIEQVLSNLINNACRYAAKSAIQVRVHHRGPGRVALVVADQGPGVTPEHQQRIFARFERAISASECSGLGLGLYIVRQIVHMHGGEIALKSEPGHGCEFSIVMPTSHAASESG